MIHFINPDRKFGSKVHKKNKKDEKLNEKTKYILTMMNCIHYEMSMAVELNIEVSSDIFRGP